MMYQMSDFARQRRRDRRLRNLGWTLALIGWASIAIAATLGGCPN